MKNEIIPAGEIAKELNRSVLSVLSSDQLIGFEKAFLIAKAVEELSMQLSGEYMKPIMKLQGNKLGFKTDKDKDGGYVEPVVKNCLIEAVLTGVQPFGNQFNIIAGNMYVTKEGFGYLLSKINGLSYKIIPELPRIKENNSGAAIVMNIEWTLNGVTKTEKLDIPVKMNAYMGTDAVIGKATRKARCWLFNAINKTEIADGDVTDVEVKVVGSKLNGESTAVYLEDLQMLFDMKKGALTEQDIKDANRILDTKEEKSYQKLYNHLQSK